jgi:hypothetical protein
LHDEAFNAFVNGARDVKLAQGREARPWAPRSAQYWHRRLPRVLTMRQRDRAESGRPTPANGSGMRLPTCSRS